MCKYQSGALVMGSSTLVNQNCGDGVSPNAVFFVAHWGELELLKLFLESSDQGIDQGISSSV